MDKISIIIPIYNVEAYLGQCIETVLRQTYPELEILLIDDGSKDSSGKICDNYAEKDQRIIVIHKENGGLSDARNAGIDRATGKYLAFIDSDDYVHPQYIELLYRTITASDSDMVICGFKEVAEQEIVEYRSIAEGAVKWKALQGREKLAQLLDNNLQTVVAWNKMYRCKLWKQLRYPKGRLQEDEFVIHHLLEQADRVCYLEETLYYYRQREKSIMSHVSLKNIWDGYDALMEREQFFIEKKEKEAYKENLINQLYYAVGHYKYVEQEYQDKELLKKFRENIGTHIHDSYVKERLGKELYFQFCLFNRNPQWYFWYIRDYHQDHLVGKVMKKLLYRSVCQ